MEILEKKYMKINNSSKNILALFDPIISEIEVSVLRIRGVIKEKKFSSLTNILIKYDNAMSDYGDKYRENKSIYEILSPIKSVINSSQLIVDQIENSSLRGHPEVREETSVIGNLIKKGNSSLAKIINISNDTADKNIDLSAYENTLKSLDKNVFEVGETLGEIKRDYIYAEKKFRKSESDLSKKLGELEYKIDGIKETVESKISVVDTTFQEAIKTLEQKKNKVDELLGSISEGVIARSYDKSAEIENKTAHWLRVGSLFCMALISAIIGFSIYETTLESFKWENALFRLVFSVLLSIPAAYLARESDKHRNLKNIHLQTSLNLKSMDPYLATLPAEEQHRLKSEMASRLFSQNHNDSSVDSYPMGLHEIVVKLLDRVEYNGKNSEGNKG
jgi:hypothetical protein